jgi:hypothetical protein
MSNTTPPAKFCNVPLNAIPIAKPAEANIARNDEVFTPKVWIIAKISIISNKALTRLRKKLHNEAST